MSQNPKATEIIDMVLEGNSIVFTDQYHSSYIALEGNSNEVTEINSAAFVEWLADTCYETLEGYVPSNPTEKQVIKVLQAKARRSGNRHSLYLNVARYGKAILYDLGNGAVKITDKNWSVVKNPPIIFRKPNAQQQQVKPKRGGDVRQLLNFMNITNESEQLLLLCYVITLFIPDMKYPALILHGTQGAGKSFLMQFIKSLVDHSELDTGSGTPKDEQDLGLNALHNYLLFYDNMSVITEKLSDALCRAVTGSVFQTRRLYTTNEVFAFKFNRPIILNGLNQIVAKGDLLDRCLVMQLERVADEKRKEEGTFKAEFEEAKPYILGAIFDTIIKAQAILNKVQPDNSTRMLGYERWGCAIAEVLGYGQDKFKQALKENNQLRHSHAIEVNPVGQAILAFMQDKSEWSGAPSALYGLLEPIWFKLRLEKPKDAPRLSKALNTLTPNLLAKGIKVTMARGDKRIITLTKITDTTDGTDGKNG
jgi:hypothetical protein